MPGVVRPEQDHLAGLAELQALVTEGLDSGISERSMDEVLEAARRQVGILHLRQGQGRRL